MERELKNKSVLNFPQSRSLLLFPSCFHQIHTDSKRIGWLTIGAGYHPISYFFFHPISFLEEWDSLSSCHFQHYENRSCSLFPPKDTQIQFLFPLFLCCSHFIIATVSSSLINTQLMQVLSRMLRQLHAPRTKDTWATHSSGRPNTSLSIGWSCMI